MAEEFFKEEPEQEDDDSAKNSDYAAINVNAKWR